ncbi:GDSL-type esterase/lipase family protein [Rhodococcus sp. BE178]|uniref:GDSL-type esterase/lipase family protein n=1 Tax=Rhodococcus sp. BE178 TaxID=2817737 RepID=UPI003D26344C
MSDNLVAVQHHRLAFAGSEFRIALSNEYGRAPVTLSVEIDTRPPQHVHFDGAEKVTLAPGELAWSDRVTPHVDRNDTVAIGVRAHGSTELATYNPSMTHRTLLTPATRRDTALPRHTRTLTTQLYVAGIDVLTPDTAPLTVALGDSVSAGYGSTVHGFPGVLAYRHGYAILNLGIAGNRLTADEIGPALQSRTARDALEARPDRVVVQIGINDLAATHPGAVLDANDGVVLAERILETAAAISCAGPDVVVATLPPCDTSMDPQFSRPGLREARTAVNQVLVASDFDVAPIHEVLEHPETPGVLAPEFDCGDGIHANDAGASAIADLLADMIGQTPETLVHSARPFHGGVSGRTVTTPG